MTTKRTDWNNYFLDLANIVKKRSPDPSRQVGCVLVNEKNRIISTGYNGLPGKMNDNIDWKDRNFVHSVVLHAEMNALLYAESKFEMSKMYITTSPCSECIKLIAASGVKEVYYHEEYKDIAKVKDLCNFFGIRFIKLI